MLEKPSDDDMEFIQYVIGNLPVSYLFMEWEDYKKQYMAQPITESDINRLELKLKLGAYKNNQKS